MGGKPPPESHHTRIDPANPRTPSLTHAHMQSNAGEGEFVPSCDTSPASRHFLVAGVGRAGGGGGGGTGGGGVVQFTGAGEMTNGSGEKRLHLEFALEGGREGEGGKEEGRKGGREGGRAPESIFPGLCSQKFSIWLVLYSTYILGH